MGQGVIVLWGYLFTLDRVWLCYRGNCSHGTGCDCVIGVPVYAGRGVTVIGVTVHMGQGVIVLWWYLFTLDRVWLCYRVNCLHGTGCDCIIGVPVYAGQSVTVIGVTVHTGQGVTVL